MKANPQTQPAATIQRQPHRRIPMLLAAWSILLILILTTQVPPASAQAAPPHVILGRAYAAGHPIANPVITGNEQNAVIQEDGSFKLEITAGHGPIIFTVNNLPAELRLAPDDVAPADLTDEYISANWNRFLPVEVNWTSGNLLFNAILSPQAAATPTRPTPGPTPVQTQIETPTPIPFRPTPTPLSSPATPTPEPVNAGESDAAAAPVMAGVMGETGPRGPSGIAGPIGPAGVRGQPGISGDPGVLGEPGPVGTEGAAGRPGEPGAPGLEGTPGQAGRDGLPGQDATPIPAIAAAVIALAAAGYMFWTRRKMQAAQNAEAEVPDEYPYYNSPDE